ncbi:alpha-amylase family protein [Paenibacillus nasutitermitis]|uniref:Beta-galactosidase n=1 Tax=Paenibacillus nasutitermitis TaxID=1652958 RepID=A0A916ZAJ5_9BACL|nr:alpha-amylase family protein [Paenibacillus nasutitermitis]GGD84317.1 hypothetical protein GCM10010911_48260 [Paenibacillus nasutitermitis]
MRFRQVHLDFHTSEMIDGIGKSFDKQQFQHMLRKGHVDSITIFSKCHHGWAYHPSEANEIHPGLDFDLLGTMIEAAHEIDVKTPVYISAGLDEKLTRRHPEWLVRNKDDQTQWVKGFMAPGYHEFCMNTPYLQVLLKQIEEVTSRYDADGIFLDIVGVRKCYCQYCIADIRAQGLDPRDENVIAAQGEKIYANYTKSVEEAIHAIKPDMPIFHNGGHIQRGRRDLAQMNSHLELESLPTGGWGYDHFPLSARYAQTLGMPYLGMTGKFHTSWGEFGGYKHPNALRYEVALNLANGARCSIGDQLHPEGLMDEATYSLIGAAYSEAEAKEAWCVDAEAVADIALLSEEAAGTAHQDRNNNSDVGAVRMLLEGKMLFDVIDKEAEFGAYRVIILPDHIRLTDGDALTVKLENYLAQGGKLLATGESALRAAEGTGGQGQEGFAIDLGAEWLGENPYRPDYFRPHFELPALGSAAYIFYSQGQKIRLSSGGTELGHREDPYFNRDIFTFCSHQHTPTSGNNAGPGMTESANGIYIAWNVFEDYATKGSLILKESIMWALRRLLPDITLRTNLPAQGVVTLQRQPQQARYVNHLLYASPVKRGNGIEVIEDIVPLRDIEVALDLPEAAKRVYLAPQGTELPYRQNGTVIEYTVPYLECHQMVVIET